jgi:hypothetical protein
MAKIQIRFLINFVIFTEKKVYHAFSIYYVGWYGSTFHTFFMGESAIASTIEKKFC